MSLNSDWRDLEQSMGRDGYKLEYQGRGGSLGVIGCLWLAFYVLAVTHSLISQRAAPAIIAEAKEYSHDAPSR